MFGAELVCPVSGCETVLESQYSSLFGLPLSLFGMLAYLSVSVLAVSAAIKKRSTIAAQADTDMFLLSGATLLSTCSAALM